MTVPSVHMEMSKTLTRVKKLLGVTYGKGRNLPGWIRPFRDKVERALTGWNSWKGKSISVQDARYSAHVEKLIG